MSYRSLIFVFAFMICSAFQTTSGFAFSIAPQELDAEYTKRLQAVQTIEATLTAKQKRDYAKTRYTRKGKSLPLKEALLKKDYQTALQQLDEVQPAFDLREDLLELYVKAHPQTSLNLAPLKEEATRLAVELIRITPEFKKKYRSIGIPLVHNTMINVGVRDRGACKHWAEDLLNHLIPHNRKYFSLTWGEANSGKVNEHNTFVIFPAGSDFYKGMLYDPWRTSGKPFWIGVKEDTHYPWQPWKEYGTF